MKWQVGREAGMKMKKAEKIKQNAKRANNRIRTTVAPYFR